MNKQTKKMTIVTPMGSIESDSGNHFVDVISVVGVVLIFVSLKYIISTSRNNRKTFRQRIKRQVSKNYGKRWYR